MFKRNNVGQIMRYALIMVHFPDITRKLLRNLFLSFDFIKLLITRKMRMPQIMDAYRTKSISIRFSNSYVSCPSLGYKVKNININSLLSRQLRVEKNKKNCQNLPHASHFFNIKAIQKCLK